MKRECGLGPCTFDDDMASKSLGWDNCDRSKNTYFCLLCCKGNGCNRNVASTTTSKFLIITMSLLVIILLEIIRGFQPPYISENIVIK